MARGRLGAGTRRFTKHQMLADGEREDQERAHPRTTPELDVPWGVEYRTEEEEAASLAFQELADEVWRKHEAPVVRQYIACVQAEPWLLEEDAAAARRLGWKPETVRDVKRRFKGHLAGLAAEQRWKALFPKGL